MVIMRGYHRIEKNTSNTRREKWSLFVAAPQAATMRKFTDVAHLEEAFALLIARQEFLRCALQV
jgi:hypothetical protein